MSRPKRWQLPPSPDSPLYREIIATIEEESARDPRSGMAWFAAVAETDLWFWQKYVMSTGKFRINERSHKNYGKLYVDEPWFFDRMREVQEKADQRLTRCLWQWFRFSLKTTSITKGGSLWLLAKDPAHTVAIFTHKIDQAGENMGQDILDEVKGGKILQAHWPQFRQLKEATPTRITVDRPPGPREPSISLYPMMSSATSGHFKTILVDDAVTDSIIDSPPLLRKVDNQISRLAPLQHDDTMLWFIGTPWGKGDPVFERQQKGDYFNYVSRQPGILPGNVPQLRSLKFFLGWKKEMLDHHFQAQILLRVVPRGEQYFREEWIRHYNQPPEQAARGCRIHAILDTAEGEGDDFTVVRIIGTTADRRRRNLDLWREKIGMMDLFDLLLGPEPGEENLPQNAWKPKKGILARWKPIDPDLAVWFEPYRTKDLIAAFRKEMLRRGRTYQVRVFPRPKLSGPKGKKRRIALLQADYRNGVIEYPINGFGHGSHAGSDPDTRDTMQQFIGDEYSQWTYDGEADNDDMLDTEAWPAQPGGGLSYPDPAEAAEQGGIWAFRREAEVVSYRQASWRVR